MNEPSVPPEILTRTYQVLEAGAVETREPAPSFSLSATFAISPDRMVTTVSLAVNDSVSVKGGDKVYSRGGAKVSRLGDEKEPIREPGEDTSGAGVGSLGVSQESSGWSGSWESAFSRLHLRR